MPHLSARRIASLAGFAAFEVIGVGRHPEGHPVMCTAEQWEVLERKCRSIEQRGMAPLIITQCAFDAEVVLTSVRAPTLPLADDCRAGGIAPPAVHKQ